MFANYLCITATTNFELKLFTFADIQIILSVDDAHKLVKLIRMQSAKIKNVIYTIVFINDWILCCPIPNYYFDQIADSALKIDHPKILHLCELWITPQLFFLWYDKYSCHST